MAILFDATWARPVKMWMTNPAGTVTPSYTSNGVYSRFRIADYGGLDVVVTVNGVDTPVYAFRVPD